MLPLAAIEFVGNVHRVQAEALEVKAHHEQLKVLFRCWIVGADVSHPQKLLGSEFRHQHLYDPGGAFGVHGHEIRDFA